MNLLVFHIILAACFIFLVHHQTNAEWVNHGGDVKNQRNGAREFLINRRTVKHLKLRWRFVTGRDVSATPAVANGAVYFPSWDGNLYAVDAFTGKLKWKRSIGQLITGLFPPAASNGIFNVTVSISTPTIAGDLLIVGIYGPAVVIAVKRSTGRLVWSTRIDPLPLSVITMSGTVHSRAFYVGVSSLEMIKVPAEQCCIFRGSMVKLDILTGIILWRTYTVRDNGGTLGGYSGAPIWESSPSIDTVRGLVYVGTGQLYSVPPKVKQCQNNQNSNNNETKPSGHHHYFKCIGPNIHYNSILALDVNFGMVKWSRQLSGYGVSRVLCNLVPKNDRDCIKEKESGELFYNFDAEFGESPMLVTIIMNSESRSLDVVVAVQKSGFAWALDRDYGNVVWLRKAGPGSQEGGGIWGAATDGYRVVYTNIANADRLPFRLAPSKDTTTTAGGWVAMSANTGRILWTTANPSNETSPGPVTLVNGVLFAGSAAPNGPFYAMNARSGKILWEYDTGATIYGGASSSYGCVYIGTGYS